MKHFNIFKLMMPVLLSLVSYQSAWALAGGTYTIGSGGNYTTLAAAVSDLNLGITGPVVFNILPGTYSGTGWQGLIGNVTGASATNTITFKAQNGPGTVSISFAGTSSANYVFGLNGASYVTIKNLTLNNTSTTYGNVIRFTGTSTFDSVVGCKMSSPVVSSTSADVAVVQAGSSSATFPGGDLVFKSDTFQNGSAAYWAYGPSALTSNHTFDGNVISNPYYCYMYLYYVGNAKVVNNTYTANSSGMNYGFYSYYVGNNYEFRSNVINTTTTYSGHYAFYFAYINYNSGQQGITTIANNTSTVNSTSNTIYGTYFLYNYNTTMTNNTFTVSGTTGTCYNPYYMAYYWNAGSVASNNVFNTSVTTGGAYNYIINYYTTGTRVVNNTFNANASGSGTVYSPYYSMYGATSSSTSNNTFNATTASGSGTSLYYMNYSGSSDTVDNNTFNMTAPAGITSYKYYMVGVNRNNTFNWNVTTGTLNNYFYYPDGCLFSGNKFNLTSTTGTIYGAYVYGTTSYAGGNFINNVFDARSTSNGTVYGFYGQYSKDNTFINNIFANTTAGTSYLYYNPSGYYGDNKFYNNTFHSNSTGTTNYLLYNSAGNTTYLGKAILSNNIFSRLNNNGTAVYLGDTAYSRLDYNLYYSGGVAHTYQCASPAVTTTSLNAWRGATKQDLNSLSYDPGLTSPATYDFRPNAANASAWSINGRGNHFANDTADILGVARAKNRFQGVPDLGAYEFVPTSTPPVAIASPAAPVASAPQAFTFGEDTVCVINWGAVVPASATLRQYTGTQASGIPTGVGKMYFYNDVATTLGVYSYKAVPYYKNPWLGDISSETNARIAKSSNGAAWAGYNYTNGITDTNRNTMTTAAFLDSMPSQFTGVENARIGIRCVVAPSGLKSSAVTAFTATETWDAVFSPIGYQYIYKTKKGTPTSGNGSYFVTSNSAPLTGLTEDTTYYIYVRTICGPNDTSGWALDSFHTIISCHAPDLKLSYLDSKQAVIYWAPIKTAVGYDWAISTDANPPANGTPTANTSVLAAYLAPGTTYYAHVRSNCNTVYSQSGWSTISFKTWATGVDNVTGGTMGLMAYPNPVKEILTIDMKGIRANNAQLTVSDITGKVVRMINVTADKTEINMNGLSSGVYILKYNDDAHTETIKVTKE